MPNQRLTAVVVSGGKQYRVAPGDRILVDRLGAEPGSEVALDRVLMLDDGDDVRFGTPTLEGVSLAARVIAHRRGPKIDVLRYKSKKRVRVHRGARAELTALEILDPAAGKAAKAETKPRRRAAKKPEKPEKAAKPETEAEA